MHQIKEKVGIHTCKVNIHLYIQNKLLEEIKCATSGRN